MRKAFTLVELLICIAIIALLAAILFPVFRAVRISAYRTQSVSNIRQLGIAWRMYAEDCDDTLMRHLYDWDYWYGNARGGVLSPYVKLESLKDPGLRIVKVQAPSYWVGYGYNGVYLSPYDEETELPVPVAYSQIADPSRTVVFAPTAGLFAVNRVEGLHAVSIIYPSSSRLPTVHGRFDGRCPVLWADLHASVLPLVYYRNEPRFLKYALGFLDSDNNPNTDEFFDLD